VAKKYASEELLLSGYQARVPLGVLTPESGDISLIALSGEDRALRLKLDSAQQQILLESLQPQATE
jgi:hypothetical protein